LAPAWNAAISSSCAELLRSIALSMEWKKLLLAAGGAAGVVAILYYLLRDDAESDKMLMEDTGKKERKTGVLSKKEVLEILHDISGMPQVMKSNMKVLTKEMSEKSLTFEQLYERVKSAQPADPLEKRGLSPEDLDRVLQSSATDPEVMLAVSKIMGPPEPQDEVALTQRAQEITVQLIVEIHAFMLEELLLFVKFFQGLNDKGSFDVKTAGIVSQAMLDSKVATKFNVTSEDMEGAIFANKSSLMQDPRFMETHMEMQRVMTTFMESGA